MAEFVHDESFPATRRELVEVLGEVMEDLRLERAVVDDEIECLVLHKVIGALDLICYRLVDDK